MSNSAVRSGRVAGVVYVRGLLLAAKPVDAAVAARQRIAAANRMRREETLTTAAPYKRASWHRADLCRSFTTRSAEGGAQLPQGPMCGSCGRVSEKASDLPESDSSARSQSFLVAL